MIHNSWQPVARKLRILQPPDHTRDSTTNQPQAHCQHYKQPCYPPSRLLGFCIAHCLNQLTYRRRYFRTYSRKVTAAVIAANIIPASATTGNTTPMS